MSALSEQSSLCIQWVAKELMVLHVDSEDSIRDGQADPLQRCVGCVTLNVMLWLCHPKCNVNFKHEPAAICKL